MSNPEKKPEEKKVKFRVLVIVENSYLADVEAVDDGKAYELALAEMAKENQGGAVLFGTNVYPFNAKILDATDPTLESLKNQQPKVKPPEEITGEGAGGGV